MSKKWYVFRYNRYGRAELSNCPRCSVWHNEDLHAAELKYTVLNVFNVMVLIVAACLLGIISNLSTILSNNSTQTHDLLG